MKQKRMISMLMALAMVFTLLSAVPVGAANADPSDESYVNAAGEDKGMKYCTHVNDGETNWSGDTTDGWYASRLLGTSIIPFM